MHFWNTKPLTAELASGTMPENEKMKYLLVGSCLFVLISYLSIYPVPERNALYWSEFGAVLAITIGGAFYCYRCNGGKEGNRFLENFVCLTVPIAIKCYALFWSAYIAFFWVTDPSKLGLSTERAIQVLDLATYFTVIGVEVLFFSLMARALSKVRNERSGT
jgi:hypothetical protein